MAKFSIHSFRYAGSGVLYLFRKTPNARIQLVFAALAFAGGCIFSISITEWLIVLCFTGLVFSLEAVNTAVELTMDFINPDYHQMVKQIKDLSAGAVLIASTTALAAGIIIFLPKLLAFLKELLQ